ncbi:MAG: hypothetical protein K6A63_02160 [Acholeplasmatales bacterium]|nr:hypothetical protein [Acholeplasmatales bacterium]
MKNKFLKFMIFVGVVSTVLVLTLSFSVFAAEGDATEAEATGESINTFLNWLKNLDMSQVRVWLGALIAKLVTDSGLILAMLIYFVKSKIKEAKTSTYYNELMSKMDEEYQKKIETILTDIEAKLDENSKTITTQIKKQNSEKRELAKANVDAMKDALSEVKVNLDE